MQRILLSQGEKYILGREVNLCVPITQSAVKHWLQFRRSTVSEKPKAAADLMNRIGCLLISKKKFILSE